MVKDGSYNFPQLKVMYSNGLFYSTSSPKPKNFIFYKEKQTLTFEKLEPENFVCFCLKK